MKKHFTGLVIMMGLCFFACHPGAKSDTPGTEKSGIAFQKLTFEDAVAQAKAQDKLIMVDFYSPT